LRRNTAVAAFAKNAEVAHIRTTVAAFAKNAEVAHIRILGECGYVRILNGFLGSSFVFSYFLALVIQFKPGRQIGIDVRSLVTETPVDHGRAIGGPLDAANVEPAAGAEQGTAGQFVLARAGPDLAKGARARHQERA
jgi:hypothetical protein